MVTIGKNSNLLAIFGQGADCSKKTQRKAKSAEEIFGEFGKRALRWL
jgi:hypothetical protein